jgi:uncharacterized protein (DUF849 family)
MNDAAFLTCAVTGSGDSAGKSPHVRDPKTGMASRDAALFRELYERVREKSSGVIINLTGEACWPRTLSW